METKTLQKILEFDSTKNAALCTQIDWRGSVPRKDYPMMLVDEDGNIIGTIGGGALEHASIELAKSIILTGKPVVKQFDLTNQNVEKDDSICGGNTTILIEPLTDDIRKLFKTVIQDDVLYKDLLITEILTKIDIKIERKRITKDYNLIFPPKVVSEITNATAQRSSISVKVDDKYYLIQFFGSKPILHIFGAGHVGQAVAEMAHFIDLRTIVYDERKDLANAKRFPNSITINNNEIRSLINNVAINSTDYVLVATRGHKHDFEIMSWLLKNEIDYISLVSSDKKWQLLSESLLKNGIPKTKIKSVHSPVGLNIGSETVPEIAISIISEIINHYRKGLKSKISLSQK